MLSTFRVCEGLVFRGAPRAMRRLLAGLSLVTRRSDADVSAWCAQLLRWIIGVLERYAAAIEEKDEWHAVDVLSAQHFSELLDGGSLDHLETLPSVPSALPSLVPPEPRQPTVPGTGRRHQNDIRVRRNTSLRPLVPHSELYGAHMLPRFITNSLAELRPFIGAHPEWGWQLIHLAAAAGRTDVAQLLTKEYHVPITVRNRKGRNVVAAAIDHRRLDFVHWLVTTNEAELGLAPHDRIEKRRMLLSSPDCARGNEPPLLSAARRLDLELVRTLLNAGNQHATDNTDRLMAVTYVGEESVDQAFRIVVKVPTRGQRQPRRKNAILKLLLRARREYDLGLSFFWRVCGITLDEDRTDAQMLSALQQEVAKSLWGSVPRDALPWSPAELSSLSHQLCKFIQDGNLKCTKFLLDEWGLVMAPEFSVGNWALGHDDFVGKLSEIEAPAQGSQKKTCDDQLLRTWDGVQASSLAAAVDKALDTIWSRPRSSYSDDYEHIERLWSMSRMASGRARSGRSYTATRTTYVNESRNIEMLTFLMTRCGMSAAPQLKAAMCSGLVWPLRWLIEQGWLRLDEPIGGMAHGSSDNDCPICLSRVVAPVTLSCGHQLCRMCARRLFRGGRLEQAAQEQEALPCPMCRTEVSRPDMAPASLVEGLADELDELVPWLRPPASGSGDEHQWLASAMPVGNVLAAIAACIGALAVLEFIASEHTTVNLGLVLGDGSTLMHFAARACNAAVVKWLVANGYAATMATQKDADGRTPLHCACRSGDLNTCMILLSQPDAFRPVACYGSDVEGEGGWVDELLSSPFEHVRDFGREHLNRVAANRGLDAVSRIIAEGGSLDRLDEIETSLAKALRERAQKDLYNDYNEDAPPTYDDVKGQDQFACFVEAATAAGRVDIVRWLFSERRSFNHSVCLQHNLVPRWVRDKHHQHVTPTYEQFGRAAAAHHGQPAFNELYDLLLDVKYDIETMRKQNDDLMRKIAEGDTVMEIEATSALVLSTRSRIPDDLCPDRRSQVGLPFLLAQVSAKGISIHESARIKNCGTFTVVNQIAIRAHLHLLEWLLAMPGVIDRDKALVMFRRSVRHSAVAESSVDVQRRLLAWLRDKHSYTDFTDMQPLVDRDDYYRDRDEAAGRAFGSPASSIHTETHSLLDEAAYQLVTTLSYYHEEDDFDLAVERRWRTIEVVGGLTPVIACNLSAFCDTLVTHYFDFERRGSKGIDAFMQFRAKCEPQILRLLQFFAARGHDLTAAVIVRASDHGAQMAPTPVSRVLLRAGWLDCLAWLVEQYPSVSTQNFEIASARQDLEDDEEWRAVNRRKLAAIRARRILQRPSPEHGLPAN